jgi:hypothetical protein
MRELLRVEPRIRDDGEQYWGLLDNSILCGSLFCGMLSGGLVGNWSGVTGAKWLGMGIGGGVLCGLAYYIRLSFVPQLGERGAALRIVLLLLFVGICGAIADRIGGSLGLFVVAIILPMVVYHVFAILAGAGRLVKQWLGKAN